MSRDRTNDLNPADLGQGAGGREAQAAQPVLTASSMDQGGPIKLDLEAMAAPFEMVPSGGIPGKWCVRPTGSVSNSIKHMPEDVARALMGFLNGQSRDSATEALATYIFGKEGFLKPADIAEVKKAWTPEPKEGFDAVLEGVKAAVAANPGREVKVVVSTKADFVLNLAFAPGEELTRESLQKALDENTRELAVGVDWEGVAQAGRIIEVRDLNTGDILSAGAAPERVPARDGWDIFMPDCFMGEGDGRVLHPAATHHIKPQSVYDLLVDAREGGSAYWAQIEKYIAPEHGVLHLGDPDMGLYEFADYPMNGGAVIVADAEGAEGPWRLDLASLERGLTLMAKDYPHHFVNILQENTDADTADAFLQLAIMGDIVFG